MSAAEEAEGRVRDALAGSRVVMDPAGRSALTSHPRAAQPVQTWMRCRSHFRSNPVFLLKSLPRSRGKYTLKCLEKDPQEISKQMGKQNTQEIKYFNAWDFSSYLLVFSVLYNMAMSTTEK